MDVPGSLRRPAYTGENRCYPCTVVNVALVCVLAAAAWPVSPALALGAGAIGLALVWLRGYVVPYTPRFAPRLADRLRRRVDPGVGNPGRRDSDRRNPGRHGARSESLGDGTTTGGDLLAALVDAGVVVTGGGVDGDLRLDPSFRDAWLERTRRLREADDGALATAAAAAAPVDADGRVEGSSIVVAGDREAWLSRPVAVAETAADETLAEWGVDSPTREAAADPLKLFLAECPGCGGAVVETTLLECCGGPRGIHDDPETDVLACESCDAVLYELPDGGPE